MPNTAMSDYEAAKAGTGNRVETFTRFLVAERALSARFGWVDLNSERFRSCELHCETRNIPATNLIP
jgi:hypothetical protein